MAKLLLYFLFGLNVIAFENCTYNMKMDISTLRKREHFYFDLTGLLSKIDTGSKKNVKYRLPIDEGEEHLFAKSNANKN